MPLRTDPQTSRNLVWLSYKALKADKQRPSPQSAAAFRQRFDRTFILRNSRDAFQNLLEEPHRRKNDPLNVLDYPEIPLRTFVTTRKISGGTTSRDGLGSRDGILSPCESP
ncbi:MAG: hypothetical protein BGP09_32385 [Rhizobium sp. 60-20]|nr:MAG: hypothetical protein BGP09_32385 [Rhizobium sp. 60-20]